MKLKLFFSVVLLSVLSGGLSGCDEGEIAPHEHVADAFQTVVEPTCYAEGDAVGACVICGEEMHQALERLPHTYESEVVAPTCEAGGYTRYTCDCGHAYEGEHTSPTTHNMSETVVAPTCEAEGYTRYTCDCGYTYDARHIPPKGHTLTETVVAPTCEEEGYTRYTCDCGYTYDSRYVPPMGHSLTETVIPPTCEEDGYTHYACENCDYQYDGNVIPAKGHGDVTAEIHYATFEHAGYTVYTCTDCGQSSEEDTVLYGDIVSGAYVENTEILKKGIDVSKWNHTVNAAGEFVSLDWEALKAAGVEFVILKAGSTKGLDPTFELAYAGAKAAGLEVGAYFFTYATTAEEALADAETMLGWIQGKQFELPIYFDLEDVPPSSMLSELGQETLMGMCKAFVGRLQEAGYYAALYTNNEWLYNLLDTEWIKGNLDVWYARYTDTWKDGTSDKPGDPDMRYGLWQYSDAGQFEGFTVNFDLNYAFKDYKSIMIRWGLNGF